MTTDEKKSPMLQKATLRDEFGYAVLPRTVSSAITMDDREYDEPRTLSDEISSLIAYVNDSVRKVDEMETTVESKADSEHTHPYITEARAAEMIVSAQLPGLADSNVNLMMASKVDVEEGKGLSTNDFTDELKQKLEEMSIDDIQETENKVFFTPKERIKLARLGNGDFTGYYNDLKDKPSIYHKDEIDDMMEIIDEEILALEEVTKELDRKIGENQIPEIDYTNVKLDDKHLWLKKEWKDIWDNKVDHDDLFTIIDRINELEQDIENGVGGIPGGGDIGGGDDGDGGINLAGLATISYVDEQIAPLASMAALSEYAPLSSLNNLASMDYVDGQILKVTTGGDISLDGYVTKQEFEDSKFIDEELFDEFSKQIGTRFEDYYTKAEVESKLKVAKDEISAEVGEKYETKDKVIEYITSAKDEISNLTKEEIEAKMEEVKADLNKSTSEQLDDLNNSLLDRINNIDVGSRNYIVIYTATEGYILNSSSGTLDLRPGIHTTDFIKVEPSTKYTLSCLSDAEGSYVIGYFNSEKGFISGTDYRCNNESFTQTITTPNTCQYVRISCPNISKTKFEKGENASDWSASPEDQLHATASKVDRSEVYLKSELYTKSEIESKLSVNTEGINAIVKATDELSSTVEKLETDTKTKFDQLDGQFELKADKTSVYTREEVYTKAETESKLAITKEAIELAISGDYTTKTETEAKISQLSTTIEGTIGDAIDSAVTQSNAHTATLLQSYYNKEQVDAAIKLSKEGIDLEYNNKYVTNSSLTSEIENLNQSLSDKINEINVGTRNLMVIYTAVDDKKLDKDNGDLIDAEGYKTSAIIKVEPDNEYIISYNGSVIGDYTIVYLTDGKLYDSGETFNDTDASRGFSQVITVPGTAAYIRISAPDYDWTKFEKGNIASDWTPAPEDTLNAVGTKADANSVYLKSETMSTEEINSAISLSKNGIMLEVSSAYELSSSVDQKISSAVTTSSGQITQILSDTIRNYYTKSETDSAIKVATDAIELGVKTNYVTNTTLTNKVTEINTAIDKAENDAVNRANTKTTEVLKSYYTAEETDSKISVAKNDITLSVSNTYETKETVSSYKSELQGAITTAQSTAISTAAKDATNKANAAQTAATNAAKATITETLTSYYTKSQTDAAIKASTEGISLSVSGIDEKIESAKNTAISTAAKDATNKVNAVKQEAVNAANNTVTNTLKNYYTKSETDSAIDIAKKSITSTVSESFVTKTNLTTTVNNAVNNLVIGGRNLALSTSASYDDNIYNTFGNKSNEVVEGYRVLTKGINVGDILTVSFKFKVQSIVLGTGGKASFSIQGAGNNTQWTSGTFPGKTINFDASTTKEYTISYQTSAISAEQLKNDYWPVGFRFDGISSGTFSIKEFKVEVGTVKTGWSPAPEDTGSELEQGFLEVNSVLADIAAQQQLSIDRLSVLENDDIITPSEKATIAQEYEVVKLRYQAANTHYDAVGDSSCSQLKTTLTNAYNALVTVMNTVLANMSIDTNYSMSTVNSNFLAFYNANESLIAALNASMGETISEHKSTIEQLTDSINLSVSKAETALGNTATFGKHFKFSDSGWVEIYATTNGSEGKFKTQITNTKLAFLDNNVEVASISNQKLVITDADIENSLQIGNMKFIPSSIGGIMIVKS